LGATASEVGEAAVVGRLPWIGAGDAGGSRASSTGRRRWGGQEPTVVGHGSAAARTRTPGRGGAGHAMRGVTLENDR